MLDAMIIHPSGTHGIYGKLGDDLVAVEQPLWCRLIGGYLCDRGHAVRIIDAEAQKLEPRQVVSEIMHDPPRLIVIAVHGHQPSASTQQMECAGQLARMIKRYMPGYPIIMVGNHPSALPVRTLKEEAVDYVGDGEGPVTIDGLLNGKPKEEIPGLVWRDSSDTIKQNPLAPLLDLDKDLHGQMWDRFDFGLYKSHNWQRLDNLGKRQPYAAIYTSLGCSYKCSFCMINIFQHTNRYRMRSPQSVVDEMVMLHREHGVETFKIIDELFVLNQRHYTAIAEGLISAGVGDKISSWCYARTDTVKPENLALLRRAGFNWFALGIESGSKKVRDMANKSLKNDDIIGIVRKIENAGINVISNFIFGLKGDDTNSMQDTLDLALELNTAWANFYVTMAYPGSALYDEAIASGWKLPDKWMGYSQHNYWTRPLDTEHVSAADVLRFRDKAFEMYFTNPRYIEMLDKRFGAEAVGHVREMTTYKLKRKLLEDAA